MVEANPQPRAEAEESLADLIDANEEAYIAFMEKSKDFARDAAVFTEQQRERNLKIAKISLDRFNEIPPQLEELLDMDDFEGAAELLKVHVKTNKQIDGVLRGPVGKIYNVLENEEPDLKALR